MNQQPILYMVSFDLPQPFPIEFVEKIPAQRVLINELMAKGKLKSYSLSADRSKLWMILWALSEEEIYELIAEMPLGAWLLPDVSQLMFHNTVEAMLPFSLN